MAIKPASGFGVNELSPGLPLWHNASVSFEKRLAANRFVGGAPYIVLSNSNGGMWRAMLCDGFFKGAIQAIAQKPDGDLSSSVRRRP
jgi:hypothetical protein